jgi:hypothetical protein
LIYVCDVVGVSDVVRSGNDEVGIWNYVASLRWVCDLGGGVMEMCFWDDEEGEEDRKVRWEEFSCWVRG